MKKTLSKKHALPQKVGRYTIKNSPAALSPRLMAALFLGASAALPGMRVLAADAPTDKGAQPATSSNANADLLSMDLDSLSKVQVANTAGFTKTDDQRSPVTMTTIDAQDIQQSGAKDLNHLFEDLVPNAEFISHHSDQDHMGIRGIISDREDKYLYQVNGRTMNMHLLNGADNEREDPLMGDINSVNVVLGPDSATHGAGAIAGLVDVQTYTGLTFQGSDVTTRNSIIDRYDTVEGRYGEKFSDDSGLFVYYGTAYQPGASPSDAPYFIGKSYPAQNGLPANVAGSPFAGPRDNYQAAEEGKPREKVFADYVKGPWDFWVRFVQDGFDTQPRRDVYSKSTTPLSLRDGGRNFGQTQITETTEYKKELSQQWKLDMMESFDTYGFEDNREGYNRASQPERNASEEVLFGRALAVWTPVESQSLAFGTEYEHDWFYDPAQSDALDSGAAVDPHISQRFWGVDVVSLLAEDQWRISKNWTVFLSAREDKHTYSPWMLSPHGSLVYTPSKNDTFKIIGSDSARHGPDEDLYAQHYRYGTIAKPETLRSYEASYEHTFGDGWSASVDGYYYDYHALGWVGALNGDAALGDFKTAGGESVLSYKVGSTRLTASAGYTKLVGATANPALAAVNGIQGISAAPYGYGMNLAEWSPWILKLAATQDLGKKVTLSSSVTYYPGFPGAQDFANFNDSLSTSVANSQGLKQQSGAPLTNPGYTTPFGANLYWNLGLEYRPTKHWTIRADGYDLAGLFDSVLNKRNYYFRLSEFTEQPTAAALSVRYTF